MNTSLEEDSRSHHQGIFGDPDNLEINSRQDETQILTQMVGLNGNGNSVLGDREKEKER